MTDKKTTKPKRAKRKAAKAESNFALADVKENAAMRVCAARAKITLRGKPEDESFLSAAQNALGFALPLSVGKSSSSNGATVLCLSPDEWILWSPDANRAPLLAKLQESIADIHAAAVDISDYYTVLELRGKNAADILSSGCPLDCPQMPAGACAQTHHGAAQILIYKNNEETFDIQVRISFAPYLWRRFETAAE